MTERLICNDLTERVRRQSDGDCLYLHCTGGFRASQYEPDKWIIEPILDGNHVCAKGYFNKNELRAFVKKHGFTEIALQNIHWRDGNYSASWIPIIQKSRPHEVASDLWANISRNLTQKRVSRPFSEMNKYDEVRVNEIFDNASNDERLSRSISLSLRSMDISIESICEYYFENLSNSLNAGRAPNSMFATMLDQNLYAHVHAFFLHLGAARDYLGALIASRIGLPESDDDFARLVSKMRQDNDYSDTLINHLRQEGCLVPSSGNKFKTSGWLEEIGILRKRFVHKKPYGLASSERKGFISNVSDDIGLFRYNRSLVSNTIVHDDLLDLIAKQYLYGMTLFYNLAIISGYDDQMMAIGPKDIISLKITKRHE